LGERKKKRGEVGIREEGSKQQLRHTKEHKSYQVDEEKSYPKTAAYSTEDGY